MKVSVAVALARRQEVIELDLAEGSTVAEAIVAARVGERFPELVRERWKPGIWSKACPPETVLREGDRVELYRELTADAKQMRRARANVRTGPGSRSEP